MGLFVRVLLFSPILISSELANILQIITNHKKLSSQIHGERATFYLGDKVALYGVIKKIYQKPFKDVNDKVKN